MDELNKTVDYPTWQPQLLAALTELGRSKLKDKIHAAEAAIFQRGLELKTPNDDPERTAMRNASRQLRTLMITVLGYPPLVTERESDQQGG